MSGSFGVRRVPAPLSTSPQRTKNFVNPASAVRPGSKRREDAAHSKAAPWPHAPPHHFEPTGTYIITAGTLHKLPLFNSPAKLDLFQETAFELIAAYRLQLEAWAFLANHYHLILGFQNAAVMHSTFLRHLHRELAVRLNELDGQPGRRVMYNFWDTQLTYEKSYLARLSYVHQNPVKHGLVNVASAYRWCSAAWFEREARPAFVKTVYSFKTDKLNVPDDF